MLQAVAKAAKGIVVVALVNGGPLSVDWFKSAVVAGEVHAVVEAFDGGQSGGQAFAEVLWGDGEDAAARAAAAARGAACSCSCRCCSC